MSIYAVKLDDNLHIIEVMKKTSPGLAHQQALRFTDDGFRARVYESDDDEEIDYLYNQLLEKRQMGFIEEFGHVPNGTRSNGDGARTFGHMIMPAFGGKLEGVSNRALAESTDHKSLVEPPLTFSSRESENQTKKSGGFRLNLNCG